MTIYFAVLATLAVLLLFATFGVLTNILVTLRELVDAAHKQYREPPILTRPPRYPQ